jgi:hypothetical protein
VDAGKKAASSVLALQGRVLGALSEVGQTAEQLAVAAGAPDQTETVYLLLEHLVADARVQVDQVGELSKTTFRRT